MPKVGLDTAPTATTYELDDLVTQAWSGGIRVPHFQRDFRWGRGDVLRLFDSIVRGYPIGSLLLWVRRSDAALVTLGEIEITAPAGESVLWVVDGQQRVTSIANALHPQGNSHTPFAIYYDLRDREFINRPRIPQPHEVALPILYDLASLLDYFGAAGPGVREYLPEAQRVAKAIRQYRIPAYLVKQDDRAVLTDIFDRMNNFGKRLSRAEVFSALFAGPEEGAAERLTLSRISERIEARTRFGQIDQDTVLHSILARRGPNPMRDIRGEFSVENRRAAPEFPDESQEAAYSEGERALVRAVSFLQEDAGVPHLSLLTYKAILVALARFFAHFPEPDRQNRRLLRRFYWRAAVGGPTVFKGSFTQMSRILCGLVRPHDEHGSVQELLRSMDQSVRDVPSARRFRTNEAVGKMILCSWWSLGPRSIDTGERLGIEDLSAALVNESTAGAVVHRIYRGQVPVEKRLWAANRLFVPRAEESGESVLEEATQTSLFADARDPELLRFYSLSLDLILLFNEGRRHEFLDMRQKIIEDDLRSFLARMTEWEFEDTAPIDSFDLDDAGELADLDE
ncbi:GmrSD restriction endonucleases N-terminal domain-containing protein [Frankia sp. AiPs1]|uniref:DUF262 domain-containing protein n=1 Tax=Frankia sp. AiPa1 TaxID=573492 RepID=UPI00202B9217|nr:DUF262 domain-containing protein [Frankia sp. AiPa1]MCL9758064.1 DUF262 domain-containing protein [Frankia sp. AiPa1]